jgi:hypothetical protein
VSNVAEAVKYGPCTKCGSHQSDPCRTPSGKATKAHAGRPELSAGFADTPQLADAAPPVSPERQEWLDKRYTPRHLRGSLQVIPKGQGLQLESNKSAARRARKAEKRIRRLGR